MCPSRSGSGTQGSQSEGTRPPLSGDSLPPASGALFPQAQPILLKLLIRNQTVCLALPDHPNAFTLDAECWAWATVRLSGQREEGWRDSCAAIWRAGFG